MSIMTKRTHHPFSISLTQSEFEQVSGGGVERIDVQGPKGKPIRSLPAALLPKLVMRAKLLLVNDDLNNSHYWVINFPR